MFPTFDDLKPMASFQIPVDFSFYLDNGFISQDQFNELTKINQQVNKPQKSQDVTNN